MKAFDRLLLSLVLSGRTAREVHDFCRDVAALSPREFTYVFSRLSRVLEDLPRGLPLETSEFVESTRASKGTIESVERLLLQEAGLQRQDAIRLLTAELLLRRPELVIPPDARKGFTAWLERLAMLISERELLFLATRIRNQHVHREVPDWKLK